MKHFVMLFPPAKNVHLIKTVGQIPYHMQRHFGYWSTLVCYKNEVDYPYLKEEVKGLRIHFLQDTGTLFFWEKAVVRYLMNNAKQIDVLNLQHLTQESMLYGLLYKFLNPYGILYLKLDMDIYHYHKEGIRFSEVSWKEKIYQKIYPSFLKVADIITIETQRARQYLRKLDAALYEKSTVLRNGNDRDQLYRMAGKPVFSQKENIVLTVGRIGTEQKNSELLLQALANIELGDWNIQFVGPIEDAFKPVIDSFFKKYPHKKSKVHFIGEISDRTTLMNYYKKAKIFCLPSRWESFGTVLTEAQCMGDYLIGTERIPPIYELTRDGALGTIIESENAVSLEKALNKAMDASFYDNELMQNIINHSKKYQWHHILKKLNNLLDEKQRSA